MCHFTEKKINNGRLDIAYRQSGNPDGQTLLLLHGWLDNAASFERLTPHLDLQRFNVIAPDLPGHGHSGHRSPAEAYHLLEYVLDCEALARALGLASVRVVGHSLGGVVAAMWASAISDRISRLFLIDSLGPMTSDESKFASQLGKSIQKILSPIQPLKVYPSIHAAVQARQLGFGQLTDNTARLLVERGVKECDGGVTWSSDRRLRHPSLMHLSEAQVNAMLSAIRCPVGAVFAEKGVLTIGKKFESRLRHVRHIEYCRLPGGHHLHLEECPDQVAQRINAFFQQGRSHCDA
ncbi:MAG: alpha/beta hydrolase [Proteobacteria bacterium]|nr:MAG: alpha/beta hydrolase [Pseudomonadota bacterium]PIE40347.1 MAG: alpha/beta hydrolase [Gammaproteobacteria bacterium]